MGDSSAPLFYRIPSASGVRLAQMVSIVVVCCRFGAFGLDRAAEQALMQQSVTLLL